MLYDLICADSTRQPGDGSGGALVEQLALGAVGGRDGHARVRREHLPAECAQAAHDERLLGAIQVGLGSGSGSGRVSVKVGVNEGSGSGSGSGGLA